MNRAMAAAAALVGMAGLALGGSVVLLSPATVIGLLAAGSGLRSLGRDLDAAHLRFGAALIVSGLVLLTNLTAGAAGPAGRRSRPGQSPRHVTTSRDLRRRQ